MGCHNAARHRVDVCNRPWKDGTVIFDAFAPDEACMMERASCFKSGASQTPKAVRER